MNKNIGDMTKEELYDLCNKLLDKDTDYMLIQRKINKIKELVKNYEELEQVLGAGKPRFPLYKLQEILGDKENE